MQFELTEEQIQMKMSVREFAEAEILPHVMEWDEAQHFHELWRLAISLTHRNIVWKSMVAPTGMRAATAIEELSRWMALSEFRRSP